MQGFPHVLFLAESAFENRQNDVLNKGEIICEKKKKIKSLRLESIDTYQIELSNSNKLLLHVPLS